MDTNELIRAFQSEVNAIIDDLSRSMSAVIEGGVDAVSARENYLAQVERLAATAELLGMQGLRACCARVGEVLNTVDPGVPELAAGCRDFFEHWPHLVSRYLDAPQDTEACRTLAAHFAGPASLDQTEVDGLALLLSAPLDLAEEIRGAAGPERPTAATDADTSLDLPEDLDQGMFDGFMQEAPGHAAEFSALIEKIAAGNRESGILKEAKRIAHTFKGSANIVGIKGIARLGHHTEDILEHLQERPEVLSPELGNILLDVAGCLEQMVCCLQGQEEKPENSRAVLQGILDWANRMDGGGIDVVLQAPVVGAPDSGQGPAAANNSQPDVPAVQVAADAAATAAPEQTLRVPVKTLDDLFRLTGELAIKIGQFQSRMKQATLRAQQLLEQNVAVQKRIFELENLVDIRGFSRMRGQRQATAGQFDSLELDQYSELHMVTRALAEETADSRELGHEIKGDLMQLGGTLLQQDRIRRELQHLVVSTRLTSIKTILPRLARNVRQTCRSTGKQATLNLQGGDTMIDGEILNRLADPLLHILRNAIDHGIEIPEERDLLGKPAEGNVTLSFVRQGQTLIVRCVDDGRGLDYAAIRARAMERGLISGTQTLMPDELARLIMLPGFSTRDSVSEISGRGVGLDVVRERIQSMKGSVDISSGGSGMGTAIELRMHATLTALHALLVEASGQVFGLPSYGIERAVAPGEAEIMHVAGKPQLRHGGNLYAMRTLAELVGLENPDRGMDGHVAVLMQVEGRPTAILVDKVIEARDLVSKEPGPLLRSIKGLNGAAVLGDGTVAPLLDIADLLGDSGSKQGRGHPAGSAGAESPALRKVVVVDDSLSVRRMLAQLLQDNGYRVEEAKDGLEAVQVIDSFQPQAILTDLEMPNMNGLELTSHLRGRVDTRDLPVIMITSRSLDKHRKQAELSGVSVYLTKPYSDGELLAHLQAQLEGGHHVPQVIH